MYTNQCVKLRWGHCESDCVRVSNGVKQGGILSPVLFTIYIDELLITLQSSGLGCYIGNLFMAALGYADDVVLITPTVSALKQMLKLCDKFGSEYNLLFNAEKYQLLHYPVRGGKQINGIYHNNIYIKCVKDSLHLGHIIGLNVKTKTIQHAVNSFNTSLNGILNYFSLANVTVKYKLFKSFCMPLYGSVLWDLSSNDILKFYSTWKKGLRRLFNLPYRTHSRYLPLLGNDLPVNLQLFLRFNKFMYKLLTSENAFVQLASKLALNGSQSSVGKSVMHISKLLQCHSSYISSSPHQFKMLVNEYASALCNAKDYISCGNLTDLMFTKECNNTRFSVGELDTIIEFLCVS